MAGKYVELELGGLDKFLDKVDAAGNGEFKKAVLEFLEGLGDEFLRVVEDEIIRLQVVDTRLLLHSFHKGSDQNLWELDEGDLTLEVGTNVQYAWYVEDGHHQKPGRFIPGVWQGDHFRYQPGADTGMVLKAKWVEGKHYFRHAIRIMEHMLPSLVERKLTEWVEQYFNV